MLQTSLLDASVVFSPRYNQDKGMPAAGEAGAVRGVFLESGDGKSYVVCLVEFGGPEGGGRFHEITAADLVLYKHPAA
ncbi:MAG: hypothetical protein ACRC7O_05960 [Fimbriiglobus sp.]